MKTFFTLFCCILTFVAFSFNGQIGSNLIDYKYQNIEQNTIFTTTSATSLSSVVVKKEFALYENLNVNSNLLLSRRRGNDRVIPLKWGLIGGGVLGLAGGILATQVVSNAGISNAGVLIPVYTVLGAGNGLLTVGLINVIARALN